MAKFFSKGADVTVLHDGKQIPGTVSSRNRWFINVKTERGMYKFKAGTLDSESGDALLKAKGQTAPGNGRVVSLDEDVAFDVYTDWLSRRHNGDIKGILKELGVTVQQIEFVASGDVRSRA